MMAPVLILAPLCAMAQISPIEQSSLNIAVGAERSATKLSLTQSDIVQPQIAALGGVASTAVTIPVLFGVGVHDITPNFGVVRASGHTHEGEDIIAVKGTPIVSPTAAVVTSIAYGASEGNAVYTANPGGETFVYYHLDRIGEGVAEGQVLERGSLIGYVGNSGDAAGGPAHLHFEIHKSGVPTDPFPRLTNEFTLNERMAYLAGILAISTDSSALARLLVTNFRGTFTAALTDSIPLSAPIIDAMASIPASTTPAGNGGPLPAGDLDINSSGGAVATLQRYLIQAATGAAAVRLKGAGATGNFGAITKAALIEFQTATGIAPASGFYGSATRAFIAAHPLSTASQPSAPSAAAALKLKRDLHLGVSGEDVRLLQRILNSNGHAVSPSGPGSMGDETIYFGPATKTAVIRLQAARGISPAAGYVGPITRAYLNTLP